jgi:hypothetical protein
MPRSRRGGRSAPSTRPVWLKLFRNASFPGILKLAGCCDDYAAHDPKPRLLHEPPPSSCRRANASPCFPTPQQGLFRARAPRICNCRTERVATVHRQSHQAGRRTCCFAGCSCTLPFLSERALHFIARESECSCTAVRTDVHAAWSLRAPCHPVLNAEICRHIFPMPSLERRARRGLHAAIHTTGC